MKKLALLAAAFAVPAFAFAQTVDSVQSLGTFIMNIINQVAVPVLFAVAFIVFIWGVFQTFILNGGDEEKREGGKSLMLYGLIGFFVMVSVWGLVNILVGSVSLKSNAPNYPQALYQH